MDDKGYVLIIQEVPLHPHSYLDRLEEAFERPSIVHVHSKEGLRKYDTPPVYDERYLVVFDSKKILESNLNYIKLDFMFPVVMCASKGVTDDVRYLLQDKKIPFRIFLNKFKKADGVDLVRDLATEPVSTSFCEALVSRVGLSPQRIISGMMVCEQVGYSTGNISKYVDKYTHIDLYDVIESLLGICKSMAQRKRAALYIHQNRHWYKRYTRQSLLREVELLLKLYSDITEGVLTEYTLHDYVEAERVQRYRALYAFDLYERVSYVTLLSLKQFIEDATILEVALRLS